MTEPGGGWGREERNILGCLEVVLVLVFNISINISISSSIIISFVVIILVWIKLTVHTDLKGLIDNKFVLDPGKGASAYRGFILKVCICSN